MNLKAEADELLSLIEQLKGTVRGIPTVNFTGVGFERLERLLKVLSSSDGKR